MNGDPIGGSVAPNRSVAALAKGLNERASQRGRRSSEVQLRDRSGPLSRLLFDRDLSPVFQPIVRLADGAIHAHEALIRGPRGMPLHTPDALLAAARREGLLQDFEVACVVFALQQWAALGQSGRLFVNISAGALVRCFHGRNGLQIARQIRHFGLQPAMIVFELTEHEQVSDIPLLVEVASQVHAAGMSFALDDFGDGRSSLRLWSELGPDVVKIDKYFTGAISQHARKLKTIRALMQIAETFGTQLVAEGVETADDLRVLRDLGLNFAQGYFLGRPAPQPLDALAAESQQVLSDSRVAVMPASRLVATPMRTRQMAVLQAPAVAPTDSAIRVAELLLDHADWHALAIVEGEHPIGLIGRQEFLNRYARPYFKEIHGREPCTAFANLSPTLIEVDQDVDTLIQVLTSQDQRYLSEGFIFTENGRYKGLGTGHALVRSVTETRIEAARHANPLTLLPGNIPISEHIERLLASGAEFIACYADLNSFKPFNDYYGYWRGDEVIKLAAARITRHADPTRDFVGHVGGDDFVVLFQSRDWHIRCERIVAEFNADAVQMYDEEARLAGGIGAEDRRGFRQFFGFTTLYMGVVLVGPSSHFVGAADVASAAARAKQAAKVSGQAIFAEPVVEPLSARMDL